LRKADKCQPLWGWWVAFEPSVRRKPEKNKGSKKATLKTFYSFFFFFRFFLPHITNEVPVPGRHVETNKRGAKEICFWFHFLIKRLSNGSANVV